MGLFGNPRKFVSAKYVFFFYPQKYIHAKFLLWYFFQYGFSYKKINLPFHTSDYDKGKLSRLSYYIFCNLAKIFIFPPIIKLNISIIGKLDISGNRKNKFTQNDLNFVCKNKSTRNMAKFVLAKTTPRKNKSHENQSLRGTMRSFHP